MTLPNLVSFSGDAYAGKDAIADLLVERARFKKTYMLKPIEQALLKMNPWIVDNDENTIERFADLHQNLGFDVARRFPETERLIALASEVGKDLLGQNVWYHQVFNEISTFLTWEFKVALSGVESTDVLALVKQYGGVTVWLDRPPPLRGLPRKRRGDIKKADCDIIIHNDGTLKDLYVNVVSALEEYDETLINTPEEN